MGVAKKGKRKITVDGRVYYWYVAQDEESLWLDTWFTLTILSEDKHFLIKYPVNQQGQHNLLIVLGKEFGGQGKWGFNWQRVKCPKWEVDNIITPGSVKNIIQWSLSDKPIVLLSYVGNELS